MSVGDQLGIVCNAVPPRCPQHSAGSLVYGSCHSIPRHALLVVSSYRSARTEHQTTDRARFAGNEKSVTPQSTSESHIPDPGGPYGPSRCTCTASISFFKPLRSASQSHLSLTAVYIKNHSFCPSPTPTPYFTGSSATLPCADTQ